MKNYAIESAIIALGLMVMGYLSNQDWDKLPIKNALSM